jgi:ankyrin repeat protein
LISDIFKANPGWTHFKTMQRASRIHESFSLFREVNCFPLNNVDLQKDSDDAALILGAIEKMRCHILNCLAALSVIQIETKNHQISLNEERHESVKSMVFSGACSMMIETELDNDEVVMTTLLSAFPDKSKMSDGKTWLPMHFAVVLFINNKISAEDVHMMHTADVFAITRLSENDDLDGGYTKKGCTPAHLLCMQKEPNMSMVRHFCIRDPNSFLLCDQSGRCTLHLAAQYSESVDLLQTLLQINEKMTNSDFEDIYNFGIKPLGLLCRRSEFPTFHDMLACLIAVDSTVEVICDGVDQCFKSYEGSELEDHNISPGSRGERTMNLLQFLLDANIDVLEYYDAWIFSTAASYLRGEVGVAVLSLLIRMDSNGVKTVDGGEFPIHRAASNSCVNVVKLLLNAYPESLLMLTNVKYNLLHLAFKSGNHDDRREKVKYLCDQCPAFIHQKTDHGNTPLNEVLAPWTCKFDLKSVICLCDIDGTAVRDKCTPSDDDDDDDDSCLRGQLPLHLLIAHSPPKTELSDEGDCLRLFLRLYPASAGIKDGYSKSPYDLAVSSNLSAYFIRLLLANDPTIDPVKRCDLNYAARKDGMFLAFRALSINLEPTIWARIRYEDKYLLRCVLSYL